MVGLFSKFSVHRSGHRRAQSALEGREVGPPSAEDASAATAAAAASHGIEVAVEFKPVEHPIEPLDNDQPIMTIDIELLSWHSCCLRTGKQQQLHISAHFHYGNNCMHGHVCNLWDGRIWKERVSATVRRRADLPIMKESGSIEPESTAGTRQRPATINRMILPSISAPEHNLLKLLEECNAPGM
ncbi:hypothetical protein BT93_D2214 [Corymbia citriodora subsp. variegata]|nr:hypothetical protein BT93_D2214 [Corymbia citriodora subsp. variegata]